MEPTVHYSKNQWRKIQSYLSQIIWSPLFSVWKLQSKHVSYWVWLEETSNDLTVKISFYYTRHIRPHLEYCIQSVLYLQKDIHCLQNVQRDATRLITGLKKFLYEERLQKLGLTTLEVRRQRGTSLRLGVLKDSNRKGEHWCTSAHPTVW